MISDIVADTCCRADTRHENLKLLLSSSVPTPTLRYSSFSWLKSLMSRIREVTGEPGKEERDTHGGCTQRTQHPLIQEYTLKYRGPNMMI